MSCGAGRGRGWLKLPKTSSEQRTGIPTVGIVHKEAAKLPLDSDYFSDAPSPPAEFKKLIDLIKVINLEDDGIVFNRKLKTLLQHWPQSCGSVDDLEQSSDCLFNVALQDYDFATRLAHIMSSQSMREHKIYDVKVLRFFLKRLQDTYEDASELQTRNKKMFRNFVHLFGSFIQKNDIFLSGIQIRLTEAVLDCYELLLSSKCLPDAILLTKMIHVSGAVIESRLPNRLSELLIKVRANLTLENSSSREHKLWLLFLLDLCNFKFGLTMPENVYKFYLDQLGATSLKDFQTLSNILTIETGHNDIGLDNVSSQVNVLQISNQENKEKAGRPILGSGARFNPTVIDQDKRGERSKNNEQ